MLLRDIVKVLEAEVFAGKNLLDIEIEAACGSDLMSDVLSFAGGRFILLTGLSNIHAVNTAAMVDAGAIVLVRGKRPMGEVIEAAQKFNLPLLGTGHYMYESCGLLYSAGLRGCHNSRCIQCAPSDGLSGESR